MSELISSRRSFLKLFGSVVVAATVPIQQIEAVLPAASLIDQSMPPNVLHIKRNGIWQAVSEILTFDSHQEVEYISAADLSSRINIVKGTRSAGEINLEMLYDRPGVELLRQEYEGSAGSTFGLSSSGYEYEFDALVLDFKSSVGGLDGERTLRSRLDVNSEVRIRSVE